MDPHPSILCFFHIYSTHSFAILLLLLCILLGVAMRRSSSKHPCKIDSSSPLKGIVPCGGKCSQTNALRHSIGPDLYDRIMQWNDSGAVEAMEAMQIARRTKKDALNCKAAQNSQQEETSPISVLDLSRRLDADEIFCSKELQPLDACKQDSGQLEFSAPSYPGEFVHYSIQGDVYRLHKSVDSEVVNKGRKDGHMSSTACPTHPDWDDFYTKSLTPASVDDKRLVRHIHQVDQPSLSSRFKSDRSKSSIIKSKKLSFSRFWKRIISRFSKKR